MQNSKKSVKCRFYSQREVVMSALACCFWWFLLGVLVGWLLSWLFDKWFGRSNTTTSGNTSSMNQAPIPLVPVATTPVDVSAPLTTVSTPTTVSPPAFVAFSAAAAAAAGINVRGVDDLIVIEGIGPKIDELLKTHGISTFEQLSKASIPEISAILEKGGSRFKLANPETWAEQAGMAHRGEWTALKALQDVLYAGVNLTKTDGAA
jgi:predicted flap endonuclease-1-like 5' DNA nuclease